MPSAKFIHSLTTIKQEEVLRACLIYILSYSKMVPQLIGTLATLAGCDSKVILDTGSRKTLIMVLPHLLQPDCVSIAVSPLKCLQVTQICRMTWSLHSRDANSTIGHSIGEMGSKDRGDQSGQPRWCRMVWGMLAMHSPECTCLTALSRRPARTARYSSLPPNNSCCIKVTSHTLGKLSTRTEPLRRPLVTCPLTRCMSLHLLVCLAIMAKLLGDPLKAIWTPFNFCYPPLPLSLLWL